MKKILIGLTLLASMSSFANGIQLENLPTASKTIVILKERATIDKIKTKRNNSAVSRIMNTFDKYVGESLTDAQSEMAELEEQTLVEISNYVINELNKEPVRSYCKRMDSSGFELNSNCSVEYH
jgi:hypothetical protein